MRRRGAIASSAAFFAVLPFLAGCGGYAPSDTPADRVDGAEASDGSSEAAPPGGLSMAKGVVRVSETFPLGRPSALLGYGEGSLWVSDNGQYSCDDTPGASSSGSSEGAASSSSASCAGPQEAFLRKIDPKTGEVEATIPASGEGQAFNGVASGAGSVWASSSGHAPRPNGGVLRIDPGTGRVVGRVAVDFAAGLDFGEGSVWATSSRDGTLSRIDPETGRVTAKIPIGAGVANDVEVDERSGAVWVASQYSPGNADELSQQDYEKGVRPEPDAGAKLVRVDPRTNRVVARIPIEAEAIEGGASGVSVGEGGAVWVTSVNGKLLRVDPETDEVVARLELGDNALHDDSAGGVEASGGAVWVRATLDYNGPGWTQHLIRVDPESNRVVGSVEVEDASGLAVGPDAVWLTTANVETGEGVLVRVVP